MVELKVIIHRDGVAKTQVFAPSDEQVQGSHLYEMVLPFIGQINECLRRAHLKDEETANE
jgi:hypothetical protein